MMVFELTGRGKGKPRELVGPRLDSSPENLIQKPEEAILYIAANRKSEQDLQLYASELYSRLFDLYTPDDEILDPICRLPADRGLFLTMEFIARTERDGIMDKLPEFFARLNTRYHALGLEKRGKEYFMGFGQGIEALAEAQKMDAATAATMMEYISPYLEVDLEAIPYGEVFYMPRVSVPLTAED
jgi:hypothetical protein